MSLGVEWNNRKFELESITRRTLVGACSDYIDKCAGESLSRIAALEAAGRQQQTGAASRGTEASRAAAKTPEREPSSIPSL